LDLWNRCFGHVEVDVVMLDRKFLVLVLQDLDAQSVAGFNKRLIGTAVAAWQHLHACRFPLRHRGRNTQHREPYMVDDAAHGAAVRGRGARGLIQIYGDAWKFHDLEVAVLDRRASHRDQEFLTRLDVLRVEMPVAHRHAGVIRRKERGLGPCSARAHKRQNPHSGNQSFHGRSSFGKWRPEDYSFRRRAIKIVKAVSKMSVPFFAWL
jgi:hypothetical protein